MGDEPSTSVGGSVQPDQSRCLTEARRDDRMLAAVAAQVHGPVQVGVDQKEAGFVRPLAIGIVVERLEPDADFFVELVTQVVEVEKIELLARELRPWIARRDQCPGHAAAGLFGDHRFLLGLVLADLQVDVAVGQHHHVVGLAICLDQLGIVTG